MEYMRTVPDKYFDLALVDPPYGIGEDGKKNESRGSKRDSEKFKGSKNTTGAQIPSTKFLQKEWDKEPPPPEYFKELIRVSKNQIIFGANHFADRFKSNSSCWIVWDKVNGESDFADCELAYTSFKTAVRKFTFTWNGMLQGDMKNKEIRIHPTQKPVKLYDWILANYCEKDARVLDTHLGSGSSAIAAHYYGVDFVGCELDKDYYEGAIKRFKFQTSQKTLF